MSKRVDIKTGFLCNCNCFFCVQADNKQHGNRLKKDIFFDMKEARKNGCTGIVLTGGEVSIRQDIFDLLKVAKKLGFKLIQVQSNGRRFFYKDFCKKAVESGMNEFAPSIHGHIAKLHDQLVRAEGAYKQVTTAIKNFRELEVPIITNTVILKPNYKYLPKIAELLVRLKVDQMQFAFIHIMGNAEKYFDDMVPKVSLAAPYIHKSLQIGLDNGIKVMAEAMPYCTMKGYEKYVSELYIPDTEIRNLNSVDLDFGHTRRHQGKIKFKQCKECKYEFICEGPWKEYPEKFGNDEFVSIQGKKVLTKNEILK
jgi:MoaA/NifB/PqqE/SkfB family radical SAM enzyme